MGCNDLCSQEIVPWALLMMVEIEMLVKEVWLGQGGLGGQEGLD